MFLILTIKQKIKFEDCLYIDEDFIVIEDLNEDLIVMKEML
jgi:hypothetical protein